MVHCENGSGKCCCRRAALLVSGIIFSLIALCHLWRIVAGHAIMMNGAAVPNWVSVAITVLAAIMAIWNFCALCCKKCQHLDQGSLPSQK